MTYISWRTTDAGLLTGEVNDGPTIQCGFELGDWLSFVSAGRDRLDAEISSNVTHQSVSQFQAIHDVSLVSGHITVIQFENYHRTGITRKLTASSSGTLLGDFVARFTINDPTATATIDGHNFEHKSKNRYNQFETDSAVVNGSWGKFEVTINSSSLPSGFTMHMYVRDDPSGEWVIHVRALALDGRSRFLRFYRTPLFPVSIKRIETLDRFLERVPRVQRRLSYFREQTNIHDWLAPFQLVELAPVKRGEPISIEVAAELSRP